MVTAKKNPRQARVLTRGSPKYPDILSAILKDLQGGRYPPGTRLPTDAEFARTLSVDRLTVGRALRELAKDGYLVRRRGSGTYVVDRSMQPPVPGRNIRVGVLCPGCVLPAEVEGTFWGSVLRGLLKHWKLDSGSARFELAADAAVSRGAWSAPSLGVGMVALGSSASGLKERPSIEAIEGEKLDCLIVLSPTEDERLSDLLKGKVPTVLVDYPGHRFASRSDVVYLDPVSGYADAVEWLVSQGRERIFFLGALVGAVPPDVLKVPAERAAYLRAHKTTEPDSKLREHAYRMALDACGLGASTDHYHAVSFNPKAIAEWGQQMLTRSIETRPQAVVCAAQRHTEILAEIFREAEQDIRVIGPAYHEGGRPHASIRVDCNAVAEAAATLVIARLQRPQRIPLRVGVNMAFEADALTVLQAH